MPTMAPVLREEDDVGLLFPGDEDLSVLVSELA